MYRPSAPARFIRQTFVCSLTSVPVYDIRTFTLAAVSLGSVLTPTSREPVIDPVFDEKDETFDWINIVFAMGT